ncbi:MAG: acyltransferase family protein [Candidatus Thiodiazotropha sp.]
MRLISIDALRFVAIVAVIVIHVYPAGDDELVGQVLNQLARFAVPCFFVVAGYFFFKKTADDKSSSFSYFIKYGVKIVYIYLIWYIIFAYLPLLLPDKWGDIEQYGFFVEFLNESKHIANELKSHLLYYLLAGGRADHLWFLPSLGMGIFLLYLAIYFDFLLLGSVLSFALYVLAILMGPYANSSIGVDLSIGGRNGPFFSSFYVFTGALLAKYPINITKNKSLIIALVGMVLHLFESFYLGSVYDLPIRSHNFGFATPIFSIGIILYVFAKPSLGSALKLDLLGKYVMGIYVSHYLFITLLYATHSMPSSGLIRVALITLISLGFVMVVSRIPLARYLVKI